MFEEAIYGCVTRKGLQECPAAIGVLLAGFEDGLEQHQVRYQVDQRVSRDVFAGPSVPELTFVAREDRGGEVSPDVGLVGPGCGQAARLQRVSDALTAYGVDHAAGVPHQYQSLTVAFRAPHPHLE